MAEALGDGGAGAGVEVVAGVGVGVGADGAGGAGGGGGGVRGVLDTAEGRVRIREGVLAELVTLAAFHPRPVDRVVPNFVETVLVAERDGDGDGPGRVGGRIGIAGGRVIGAMAVAYSSLNATWRAEVWPDLFGVARGAGEGGSAGGEDRRARAGRVNDHVRTIARLVVRPEWRGVGLGTALVRAYLDWPATACTDAATYLDSACGVFVRAGMWEVSPRPARADERAFAALGRLGVSVEELAGEGAVDRLMGDGRRWAGVAAVMRSWAHGSKSTRVLAELPDRELVLVAGARLGDPARVFAYRVGGGVDGGGGAGGGDAGSGGRRTRSARGAGGRGAGGGAGGAAKVAEASAHGERRQRRLLRMTPRTPEELHAFVRRSLGVDVPRRAVADGSSAPFDYLVHTFFEGRGFEECGGGAEGVEGGAASNDCVVWAARGTGKTFLGAVATLLDLVFKPGISVRILGGSLEQSGRMHEHLAALFDRARFRPLLASAVTSRTVVLRSGSRASVLAASQTSVRGVRVQKVRCDEVDLFAPALWSAAQLTTRSAAIAGPWGSRVRPAVEALSTMHVPGGLMSGLVGRGGKEGGRGGGRVFRWNILDVLARCGPEHGCDRCVLWSACAGRIKARDAAVDAGVGGVGGVGFVPVSDAVAMRGRVDSATWSSEMLCAAPSGKHAVYPMLSVERHVYQDGSAEDRPARGLGAGAGVGVGRWVVGVDFGYHVCAAVLAHVDGLGVIRIVRERIAERDRIERLLDRLDGWRDELAADGVGRARASGAIEVVAVDPAGKARSQMHDGSAFGRVVMAGYATAAPRARTEAGLGLVRARLEGDGEEGEGGGERGPRLVFSSRCPGTFSAMRALRYAERAAWSSGESVVVKDGNDHASDAVRYLVAAIDLRTPTERGVY